MTHPLLSICIPTYNRAKYLKQSLESIIHQKDFSEIEVVVSDNCSTDCTKELAMGYAEKYPNIHYYRNAENIRDANFSTALQRGSGKLRKLSNDTVIYFPGSVNYLLSLAQKYGESRPVVYFLNGRDGRKRYKEKTVTSADAFLREAGHRATWIAGIAVWDEDCGNGGFCERTFQKYGDTNLAQVALLLEMIGRRRKAVLANREIMESAQTEKKDISYGLYHVFYEQFLAILDDYRQKGVLSADSMAYMRKDLLLNFFYIWAAELAVNRDRYQTNGEDLKALLHEAYRDEGYYRLFDWRVRGEC